MDPDRTDRRGSSDDRPWTLKRTLRLCAAFAAPLVLLIFAGSLAVVPLIYLAVCVEGVFIAYVAISEVRSADGRATVGSGAGDTTQGRGHPGGDRVETLSSYVKWAAKGSDFSRRDVARTVMRIVEHTYAAPSSGAQLAARDPGLSEAIKTLVYPYRSDPFVKVGIKADEATARSAEAAPTAKPPGRARYLAGLEEVVSELEQRMYLSRSARGPKLSAVSATQEPVKRP
jgi:hypothetical protein